MFRFTLVLHCTVVARIGNYCPDWKIVNVDKQGIDIISAKIKPTPPAKTCLLGQVGAEQNLYIFVKMLRLGSRNNFLT